MRRHGPDFIVIGAQKAGTASLYQMLRKHWQCWLPPVKELHLLDEIPVGKALENSKRSIEKLERIVRSARHRQLDLDVMRRVVHALIEERRDVETYKHVFEPVDTTYVTGEVTPSYAILSEQKVREIAQALPEAKILYTVRDPISRLWSHARMLADRSGRPFTSDMETFTEFCERDDVQARSFQSRTIQLWGEHFGDHFHVFVFDDLKDRPEVYFAQVADALGIEGNPEATEYDLHENRKAKPPQRMPPEMREHAEILLRDECERLANLLGGHAERWRLAPLPTIG